MCKLGKKETKEGKLEKVIRSLQFWDTLHKRIKRRSKKIFQKNCTNIPDESPRHEGLEIGGGVPKQRAATWIHGG